MSLGITFIVSAYDRPYMLRCCLASLQCQTWQQMQILVADNADNSDIAAQHRAICDAFDAVHLHLKQPSCYHAAELAITQAEMEYVCFPSDDSYYVPVFAERMLQSAMLNSWDLVYCNCVYELCRLAIPGGYGVLKAEPRWSRIDKTGFILKRDRFKAFPNKGMDGETPVLSNTCGADGYLIEQLLREGIKHGRVDEVLAVHN